MEIEIRPCTAGDAPALSLVAQATTLETYPHVLPLSDMLLHTEGMHGSARFGQLRALMSPSNRRPMPGFSPRFSLKHAPAIHESGYDPGS